MNIAILSYEFPPDTGFGGIGSYSYYHARALVRLGHRVHVFAGSTSTGLHESEQDGVRVTRVKIEGWLQRAMTLARRRQLFWFQNRVETAQAMHVAVTRAVRSETFDIIEAPECGADASLLSLRPPAPLVVRLHSPARLIMDTYPVPPLDRRLTGVVEQVAIDRAGLLTACSQFLAREAHGKLGVTADVHVIPNGLDLALFDRQDDIDVAERFGVPDDALMVLFANRLEERKGIHLVCDAILPLMAGHRDVHMVLAGRDLFGYVEQHVRPRIDAAGFGARLHVLGGLPLGEVRALVKRADIFMLPSLWENCPYSCIEAMAGCCAIVASDCGGVPELIQHDTNGLLAPTGRPDGFAAGLERLVRDPVLRRRLGAAARQTVEDRLTDVAIAHRTVELYQSWLSGPVRTGARH